MTTIRICTLVPKFNATYPVRSLHDTNTVLACQVLVKLFETLRCPNFNIRRPLKFLGYCGENSKLLHFK